MKKRRKRKRVELQRRLHPGCPPGTLCKEDGQSSKIRVIAYGQNQVKRLELESLVEARQLANEFDVVWIDVVGVTDIKLLKQFGDQFKIHPLSLEDVVNVNQRAKFDKFEDYTYYVTQMGSDDDAIMLEQLSIFHCGKFVISFQEFEGDCLNPLRNRIVEGAGFIRKRQADYLVYAIIDMVLDHYFPIVDAIGERLDELDSHLMESDKRFSASDVHSIRSELLELGRVLRPNREMINQLLRDEASTMSLETQVFMRDCYDHIVRLYETIESYREICSDLRAYHLSVVSNRTNDVMKTLTIISSIFIPLGFIAGLYGMNFTNMPELHWKYGYFFVVALMIAVASGLLFWFRKRGWFDD